MPVRYSSPDQQDRLSRQSKQSNVEANLFRTPNPKANRGPDVGVININELRDIRSKTMLGKQQDAAIIREDELGRIKATMTIKSPDQLLREKRAFDSKREQQQFAATMRKERMAKLDKVREMKEKPSALTLEDRQRKEGMLSRAQMLLDEQLDDVKAMNQMCFYSKVVTVRDKQLLESQRLEQEYIEEQKKLDLMMEIERLKGLAEEDRREQLRARARKQGAQVIIDQIGDRQQERLKEQEIRARERELMRKQVEKIEADEERKIQDKMKRTRQMLVQVRDANDMSKTIKDQMRSKEMEEDAAITKYQRDKDQREFELQQQQRAEKEQKERDIQRLRELQEKAADRQADIDALRAKRAFEEGERNARQREKLEYEKKQRLLLDLEDARQRQFKDQQVKLAQQADTEKESFLRVLRATQESEERDRRIAAQRLNAYAQHKDNLSLQIQTKSETKKQERADYMEEGRKLRIAKADEIMKLESIKVNKLAGLSGMGIDNKYLSELERKKVAY